MPYAATAIKIMIASPSDVIEEPKLIRNVIAEWNAIYSESTKIVLMPVSWETHAAPGVTSSAQSTINREILAGCDLLIATFWTRLGSATSGTESGTVEEIRKHVNAAKPAMIYFSSVPVIPEAIDQDQYSALVKFKQECFEKYLVEVYQDLQEYRNKMARQLATTLIRHFNAIAVAFR